jgi:hypothetical protein
MYRDSCGQTPDRLVQGIFGVMLLVLLWSGIGAMNGSAIWNRALAGSEPSSINWALLSSTTAIRAGNSGAPSPAGNAGAFFAIGGALTAGAVLPVTGSLPCLQTNGGSCARSTCAAAVTDNNPALTTPALGTAPAAAATFTAARTAALNGTSGNRGISPVGLVSALAWGEVIEQRRAALTWQQCYLLTDSAS